MKRELVPAEIVRTIERLNRRIEERFPDSGLCRKILQKLMILDGFAEGTGTAPGA